LMKITIDIYNLYTINYIQSIITWK
jgi:hypothetical protein